MSQHQIAPPSEGISPLAWYQALSSNPAFLPDPAQAAHIEPGSWSGADNGDPQFMKWFSRYNEPYSPDLNSWAVLTAFQNAVHTLEDAAQADEVFSMLMGELVEPRRKFIEANAYKVMNDLDV